MKLGFWGGGRPPFYTARGEARVDPTAGTRWRRSGPAEASGGAAVSRPRPRFFGLEPGKGKAALKRAGPKMAWAEI